MPLLRVPKDTELALVLADVAQALDGVIHAEVLVILRQHLGDAARNRAEEREVLSDVEQAALVASAANHRVERDDAVFLFIGNLLPFGEVLPLRCDGADAALVAVGEDDERVVPEQLWDGIAVVAKIVVVGVL